MKNVNPIIQQALTPFVPSNMNYQCVSARFLFFNGKNRYTVHYAYGIQTWYVFEDDKESDALYNKKIQPLKSKSPNRDEAETILFEYLETITP